MHVVERTRAFLFDLVDTRSGETVIVVAHSANRWSLDYLLRGIPLEQSVNADFAWQPGWEYGLDAGLLLPDREH